MILNSTQPLEGYLKVSDKPELSEVSVTINAFGIDFKFLGRGAISIPSFTSSMLQQHVAARGRGEDTYHYSGPRLGWQTNQDDMRESPYVEHYISQLTLNVRYTDKGMMFNLSGNDRSLNVPTRSSSSSWLDRFSAPKAATNHWEFCAEFFYRYHQIK